MPDPTVQTAATYDQVAAQYVACKQGGFPGLDELLDRFSAALPVNALVADIGCGSGMESQLLRGRGLRVIGLDRSAGMLRQGQPGWLVQADMRALPLADQCLDGIWCQAALLHLPRADVPAALAEFARVTRPGGVLHLVVAEGDSEGWEVAQMYGTDRSRWFTYHQEHALTALLDEVGFEITATRRSSGNRNWLGLWARRVPHRHRTTRR